MIIVILIGINNYRYGLLLGLILIIFTRFVDIVRINASKDSKEGFELSQESQNDFLHIQVGSYFNSKLKKFRMLLHPTFFFVVDIINKS